MNSLWHVAWFLGWGIVLGAVLTDAYHERRARRRRTLATLRVSSCVLIGCELDMLVTYNDEDGISELRDFAIMPREVWERIEPQVEI